MKTAIKYIIFLCLIVSSLNLKAQVEAPDLYCVSFDTLNWESPNVTCGPIMGYEIYMSSMYEGPYTLVHTVNDPSLNQFVLSNPGGDFRYYFMRTIANCPGETFLNSDTLDNRFPPSVEINYVSVESGGVRIYWNEVVSNEDLEYIVYRGTNIGTVAVGSVKNQTEFLDTGTDGLSQIEYYYVVTVDNCGNQSLYDISHQTIFVEEFTIDECNQGLSINHSPYSIWGSDLEAYRIMLSADGAPFSEVSRYQIPSDAQISDIKDGVTYRFRVEALHKNDDWISSSGIWSFTPHIKNPIREFDIVYATYRLDGSHDVDLVWAWNDDADIINAQIALGSDEEDISPTSSLMVLNNYTIQGNTPPEFLISGSVIDSCNDELKSTYQLIELDAKYIDRATISLDWSPFKFSESDNFKTYHLLVLNENYDIIDEIDVGKLNTYTYHDTNSSGQPICFAIKGVYDYTSDLIPDAIEYVTLSLPVCVQPESILHFPNAIAPAAKNNIFKPKGLFLNNIEDYSLQIFTREGRMIFSTEDVSEGWDGEYKNTKVSSGIYTYRASYTSNGKQKEHQGIITVIY